MLLRALLRNMVNRSRVSSLRLRTLVSPYLRPPYENVTEVMDIQIGDLVTWNPAAEKSGTMADMEEDGWKKFICLEPGHVKDFINIQPGQSWTCSQRIIALSARLSLPANNAAL